MDKILVTTPEGNVGLATLRQLKKHPNRANLTLIAGVLPTEKTPPSETLIEVNTLTDRQVSLDFTQPHTFDPALLGVVRVLLVRPPALADVDRYFRPFVEAMQRAGVQQVVFLSLQGVENNTVTPHHKIEKLIREAGGRKARCAGATPLTLRLGYTMLRPCFFMQNLSTTLRAEIRDRSEIFVPAGHGRTSFVDVRDLAEVAAQALAAGQHLNTALELTGSQALTYTEIATTLTDVLGRKITYRNPSMLRFIWQKVLVEKLKIGFVLIMVALYTVAKLGKAAGLTNTLAELLGRLPTTFRQFAEDNKALWLTK
jgi:uncharacterized protein YbjT (DUF2867 family)